MGGGLLSLFVDEELELEESSLSASPGSALSKLSMSGVRLLSSTLDVSALRTKRSGLSLRRELLGRTSGSSAAGSSCDRGGELLMMTISGRLSDRISMGTKRAGSVYNDSVRPFPYPCTTISQKFEDFPDVAMDSAGRGNWRTGLGVGGNELRLKLARLESDPMELDNVLTERMDALRSSPTFEGKLGDDSVRVLKVEARRLASEEMRELIRRER